MVRHLDAVTERALLDAILQAAKLGGWLAYHTHDSRRSAAGFPDLVLVRGTQALFVELKTEKGKVTPEQATWIAALRTAGLDALVWRPADLDGALAFLTRPAKKGAST